MDLPSKKATGHDEYSAELLKLCADSIAPSIAYVLNKCISTGKFISEWKCARVSAIFKKGTKLDAGNYRPVSVLPIISKVMERIMHQQLYDFLSQLHILNESQSGFRKSHSTQSCLHRLSEKVLNGIHKSEVVGMVAVDLKKAFDTVDHEILKKKLEHYGVRGSNLALFESFLNNRKQFARVNNVDSEKETIITGVPQGSILGPLLFILYVNDLPGCVRKCEVNMYADDTAIYYSHRDVLNVSAAINFDLQSIYSWFCANKVSMHFGKTVTMLISSPQKRRHLPTKELNIKINDGQSDHVLNQVSDFKYLGVTLDQCMNFNDHVSNVVKKISKAIGILKYCRFLPRPVLLNLYNSIVLPHFDYCSTIFYPTSSHNMVRLQRLQNRAMRVILSASPHHHIEDMLNDLKWMSVKQRFVFNHLVFMWKIVNQRVPNYLSSQVSYVHNVHGHFTRSQSNHDLFIGNCHKDSLFNAGARLWNLLPFTVRSSNSLESFKKSVIMYIFNNIERF